MAKAVEAGCQGPRAREVANAVEAGSRRARWRRRWKPVGGGRRRWTVAESRWRLMKKADPSRRSRKGGGSEVCKPRPSEYIRMAVCPPTGWRFFSFLLYSTSLLYKRESRSTPTSCARESHLWEPESIPNSKPRIHTEPEPLPRTCGLPKPPLNSSPRTRTYPQFRTRSYPEPILRHEPDYAVALG